jgi:hypothetical protein
MKSTILKTPNTTSEKTNPWVKNDLLENTPEYEFLNGNQLLFDEDPFFHTGSCEEETTVHMDDTPCAGDEHAPRENDPLDIMSVDDLSLLDFDLNETTVRVFDGKTYTSRNHGTLKQIQYLDFGEYERLCNHVEGYRVSRDSLLIVTHYGMTTVTCTVTTPRFGLSTVQFPYRDGPTDLLVQNEPQNIEKGSIDLEHAYLFVFRAKWGSSVVVVPYTMRSVARFALNRRCYDVRVTMSESICHFEISEKTLRELFDE